MYQSNVSTPTFLWCRVDITIAEILETNYLPTQCLFCHFHEDLHCINVMGQSITKWVTNIKNYHLTSVTHLISVILSLDISDITTWYQWHHQLISVILSLDVSDSITDICDIITWQSCFWIDINSPLSDVPRNPTISSSPHQRASISNFWLLHNQVWGGLSLPRWAVFSVSFSFKHFQLSQYIRLHTLTLIQ